MGNKKLENTFFYSFLLKPKGSGQQTVEEQHTFLKLLLCSTTFPFNGGALSFSNKLLNPYTMCGGDGSPILYVHSPF